MKTSRASMALAALALVLLEPGTSDASPELRFPGSSQGGWGFHGFLVPFNRGQAGSETWKGGVTGGFGLFGEFLPIPLLALGLEATLAFPRVERKTGGDVSGKCTSCNRDLLVQAMARVKVPFQFNKTSSIYPILLLGYSHYHHFTTERKVGYDGLAFAGGLGVEVYTYASAVAIEFRYGMHHTPSSASPGPLTDHSLLLLMSFRTL